MHVYVCILCVCLRRPKPFVCTHRERANNLRAEREKQSRLMNDPLLVGGCELYLSLYNIRSNMYPADQEKTFAIICLCVCVCVCAALLCAVSGTCSWCSIFFFSAVLFLFSYKRRINALNTFVFLSMSFGLHRTQTAGPEYYVHTDPDPPLFFRIFCSNMRWIGLEC